MVAGCLPWPLAGAFSPGVYCTAHCTGRTLEASSEIALALENAAGQLHLALQAGHVQLSMVAGGLVVVRGLAEVASQRVAAQGANGIAYGHLQLPCGIAADGGVASVRKFRRGPRVAPAGRSVVQRTASSEAVRTIADRRANFRSSSDRSQPSGKQGSHQQVSHDVCSFVIRVLRKENPRGGPDKLVRRCWVRLPAKNRLGS